MEIKIRATAQFPRMQNVKGSKVENVLSAYIVANKDDVKVVFFP